jgi:hypothetical protein
MKFFSLAKDGGAESHVTGFFFVEIKKLLRDKVGKRKHDIKGRFVCVAT